MKPSYAKRQKAAGFKVGDTVFVTRTAKDFEDGWCAVWVPPMDDAVGYEGKIIEINSALGCIVFIPSQNICGYRFPYFVLEDLSKKITNKTDKQTFNELLSV